MPTIRVVGGALAAAMLTGCAGSPLGGAIPVAPNLDMTGRWILAALDAPSCGMNFTGGSGAQEGSVAPDGGCPGNFYTSQRWTLQQDALTIKDQENQPLAHLTFADGHFEGQATAGLSVTLTREILGPT